MALTYRHFRWSMYEEHLEELSFLYLQRLVLRGLPEISWRRIGEFEQRMEAHVDALVVGGDLALAVCRAHSQDGDTGEAFAAASVFCRQTQSRLMAEQLQSLDPLDLPRVVAIADALEDELPSEWAPFVETALANNGKLVSLLARVSGRLRLPVAASLWQALRSDAEAAPLIDALASLRAFPTRDSLLPWMKHHDVSIRHSAALASLRMGWTDALSTLYLVARREPWPRPLLALAGDETAVTIFRQIVESGQGDADCMLALGTLGHSSSLPLLQDGLKVPRLAEAAALGLQWMTGAGLFEDRFIPAEVDEDALSDEELIAWRQRGEAPQRDDGTPFGETVRALTTDSKQWKHWLAAHIDCFKQGLRYRNGVPYGPDSLLHNLTDEHADDRLRKLAWEELEVRYGCDVCFHTHMPVARQVRTLHEIAEWVRANGPRFTPGRFYFVGRLQ